ncbi:hypothetical protein CDAR_128571 [Caerostris darwini]|uniref:Uncharacterized protein n=1 Tax=Caerostris darwini TaxID=1538125 RepID=A0AAV4VHJ9_9ARAC|nr:hypothetical protein CDAR_128571 [Caerostris darwini]
MSRERATLDSNVYAADPLVPAGRNLDGFASAFLRSGMDPLTAESFILLPCLQLFPCFNFNTPSTPYPPSTPTQPLETGIQVIRNTCPLTWRR